MISYSREKRRKAAEYIAENFKDLDYNPSLKHLQFVVYKTFNLCNKDMKILTRFINRKLN